MAAESLAKVGILSIGDMGMGIAKLLVAHGFSVSTNCTGRSQATVDRAKAAAVDLLPSDADLARHCDIILSVVPPRDAFATAQRIVDALPAAARPADAQPLYFADMNAVAPATCKKIAALFGGAVSEVRLVDGCILGGPPRATAAATPGTGPGTGTGAGTKSEAGAGWYRPLMPTSGPHDLTPFPTLADTLRSRHLGPAIGAASGLKMCFASMTKGYAAIAIQAFTTAHKLGVLGDLQWAMGEIVSPARVKETEGALTGMAPKAYRWVREMEEISATFAEEGGFDPASADIFSGAAGVFRAVAEDTVLGQEVVGARKRGRTAEDVATAMADGLDDVVAKKKQKTE